MLPTDRAAIKKKKKKPASWKHPKIAQVTGIVTFRFNTPQTPDSGL